MNKFITGFFPVGPLLKFWVINAQTIQLQIMNYPFLLDVDLLWPYSWIPWWCLLMGSLGCEKNIQFLYQKMGWPGSAGDFPNHIHPIHERIALQGHLHRLSDIWSLKPMFLSLWLARPWSQSDFFSHLPSIRWWGFEPLQWVRGWSSGRWIDVSDLGLE